MVDFFSVFSTSMKWTEFLTWCADFPVGWLISPGKCLEIWYVGAPMLLTMSLNEILSFCILGRPYILGVLEPAGHICRRVSSDTEDFTVVMWFFVLLHPKVPWPVFCMLGLPKCRRFSVCSPKCSVQP